MSADNEICDRRQFVAYWRNRYQYSATHAFLDELGNFCTPGDDPIHMGWAVWQAAQATRAPAPTAPTLTDAEIDQLMGEAFRHTRPSRAFRAFARGVETYLRTRKMP